MQDHRQPFVDFGVMWKIQDPTLDRSLGITIMKMIKNIIDAFKTGMYVLYLELILILQKYYELLIVFSQWISLCT